MTNRKLRSRCNTALFVFSLAPLVAQAQDPGKCIRHEDHAAMTFVLIDRTSKLSDTTNLSQTLRAVREMVAPGERLMAGVASAKMSDVRVLMDLVRPASSMWESVMKVRAKEKVFTECLQAFEQRMLEQDEEHKSSAIAETVNFVARALSADPSPNKRLLIFSDMVQNSGIVSFVGPKQVDTDGAMKRLEKDQLLSSLPGVSVYVSGAGVGVADDKARVIEEFWRQYFGRAGATIKFYGPLYVGG